MKDHGVRDEEHQALLAHFIRRDDYATMILVAVIIAVALGGAWGLNKIDNAIADVECNNFLESEFLIAVGDSIETEDRTSVFEARDKLREYNSGNRSSCP